MNECEKHVVRADEMACFLFHCGLLSNDGASVSACTSNTAYLQYGGASSDLTLVFDFGEYVTYMSEFYQAVPVSGFANNVRLGGVISPKEAEQACYLYSEGRPEMLQRAFMGDVGLHIALQCCYQSTFQYLLVGFDNVETIPDVDAHLRRLRGTIKWKSVLSDLRELTNCYKLSRSLPFTDSTWLGMLATALYASYREPSVYPIWQCNA